MLKLAIILAVTAVSCVQAQNKYFLYTRNNPVVPELIPGARALTASSNYNVNDTTIILIHGHGASYGSRFNTLIRQEILVWNQEPQNVIVVDWEIYASFSYSVASRNVPGVGHELAYFIRAINEAGVDVRKIHLVGFGLGAHVAGIAGRWLYRTTDIVGRITGLDPSGSGWGTNSKRLRADDAQYVEVIHTDGSGPLANGIGTAIGQINFYANGGSNQPGCYSHSCSHDRAYELFGASMRGHLFGNSCSSMTQMNLNLCRGRQLKIGGTELSKRGQNIYRINFGRHFPY